MISSVCVLFSSSSGYGCKFVSGISEVITVRDPSEMNGEIMEGCIPGDLLSVK